MVIVNIIWLVVYLPRKNDGVKVSWEQYIPKMENMFKLFQATNQLYQLWNHITDPHKVVPPQVINGL